MNKLFSLLLLLFWFTASAQQYPNNEFKKWGNEYDDCPTGWSCNNDADCTGKVTRADKIKGGAKLTVVHCWNPSKEGRSNNVNMSCDEMSAKIPKGKKVKVTVDYSFTPVGNDAAYIKIDTDFDEKVNDAFPVFFYNDSDKGWLKQGKEMHMACYLNFEPNGRNYVAPKGCTANTIRTAFGIMNAENTGDVHKGSTLIINRVKFEYE